MKTSYTLEACENLISQYIEAGGEAITLEEGTLGLGLVVCFCEGYKTAIIQEFYINPWQSGHTIRRYNKMPKKYEKMLEGMYALEDYIDLIESYTAERDLNLRGGDTIEDCAEHIMNWCDLNNHNADSIPYPELESIISMYYK